MVCESIFDTRKWELRLVAQDYHLDANLLAQLKEMSRYLNSTNQHVKERAQTYHAFIEFCIEMNKVIEVARLAGIELPPADPNQNNAQAVISNLSLAFDVTAQRMQEQHQSQS